MFADRVAETTTTTGTGPLTLLGTLTGHRTWTSQFGTNDLVSYGIYGDNGEFEEGVGHLSSSTVLVRDLVIASSNSNALVSFSAGTKVVYCTPNESFFNAVNVGYALSHTSGQRDFAAPTAPSGVHLGAVRQTPGEYPELMAAFADFEMSLDTGLFSGQTMLIGVPNFNATGTQALGSAGMSAIGTFTGRNPNNSHVGQYHRVGGVSASSAGSFGGWVTAGNLISGNTTLGGFFSILRFAASDVATVAGARMFVGYRTNTAAPANVEVDTLTNAIGVGQLAGDDSQLQLICSGSSAQPAVPLGTDFPPMLSAGINAGPLYEFALYNTRDERHYWGLRRLDTLQWVGGQLTGTIGVARPANTSLIAVNSWRCNNATALAVGLDFVRFGGKNFRA